MSLDDNRTLDKAMEAMVFAADEPAPVDSLRRTFCEMTGIDVTPEDVQESIARLNAAYEVEGHTFHIHNWGGGFRMATVESVAGFVKSFLLKEEEKRLSRSLLETLSVVAYKQPASKPEVDHVRGVQSDYAIRQLLERDFITVVGRADTVGRPLLYGTTEHFLDQFGLGTLEELPRPREIDELLEDPAFSKERAMLASEMAMMEAEAAHDAAEAEERAVVVDDEVHVEEPSELIDPTIATTLTEGKLVGPEQSAEFDDFVESEKLVTSEERSDIEEETDSVALAGAEAPVAIELVGELERDVEGEVAHE